MSSQEKLSPPSSYQHEANAEPTRPETAGTKTIEPRRHADLSPPGDGRANRHLSFLALTALTPDPDNPRKHTKAQIRAIARSIEAFGFNAPVLTDKSRKIVAGHGRYEAAKFLGLTQIPVIFLDHLTETQARAYMLADNKLTDRSTWDDRLVATHLKELSGLVLNFEIEAIGFEPPEIDFRIQSLDATDNADAADEFAAITGASVSVPGDLWLLGPHRLYCGSALDLAAYTTLMTTEKAAAVFSDPPYNVTIDGNVCNISGKSSVPHREFSMGVGEMTEEEFADFLTTSLKLICAHTTGGAMIYTCMDWRHMTEILTAGRLAGCSLLNLCVWAKNTGGMGSLYRSRHELVFVFKNGKERHLNNIQLGRFGRNRTNVWNYPGVNSFWRKGSENALELHPTVKPIALVSDAILDSTKRGDVVLDPFLGSGTTILAAERTGRRCYGIEIDPIYVDTAIQRWQRLTGREATNSEGKTFAVLQLERGIRP